MLSGGPVLYLLHNRQLRPLSVHHCHHHTQGLLCLTLNLPERTRHVPAGLGRHWSGLCRYILRAAGQEWTQEGRREEEVRQGNNSLPETLNKTGTSARLALSALATGARSTAKVVPHRSYFLPYLLDRSLSNSVTGIKCNWRIGDEVSFLCKSFLLPRCGYPRSPVCVVSDMLSLYPLPLQRPHRKCSNHVTTEYRNNLYLFFF